MVRGPLVYRGAKEICGAVGIPYKEIASYVRSNDLPAFKIKGSGCWIALPDDLLEWVEKQRDEHLVKK